MRIVYDDTMQNAMVSTVKEFMAGFNVKQIVEYSYGIDRVQMHKLKRLLNQHLMAQGFRIGDTVTHAHGIGNNCCYPVYYAPKGATEIQQCGSINLNTGLYGEGYVSFEDYNGKRVGPAYEVRRYGVKFKN